MKKLVVITPARNEEHYIRTTLECMASQTIKPDRWIIVNDGSNDNTDNIINEYINKLTFLRYISLPDRGYRRPGQGVVEAFYEGMKLIKDEDYDVISKFDADLDFRPDTLETIIDAFNKNTKLGITGATRYDRIAENGGFKKVLVPKGFVGGPCKFYRRKCFEDISGLIKRAGWDGVDTIKANMNGWETGEIESLRIQHLRPTGTAHGEGLRKACEKYGDVSYYMGGYIWYFVLRVLARSAISHNPGVGYYMVKGYMNAFRKNEGRESIEFRKHLKRIQIKNTVYWVKQVFGSFSRGSL